MLVYYEDFIKTNEDLNKVEDKLHDYEDNIALIKIITDVFSSLKEKIEGKLCDSKILECDKYTELERILQKHEAEIREHIRVEQQLKLYAETL